MEYMNQHLPSFPSPSFAPLSLHPLSSSTQLSAFCSLTCVCFYLFHKISSSGPFELGVLLSLVSQQVSLFFWKHDIKYKTNKNKENQKLTEYYHKLKETMKERKKLYFHVSNGTFFCCFLSVYWFLQIPQLALCRGQTEWLRWKL